MHTYMYIYTYMYVYMYTSISPLLFPFFETRSRVSMNEDCFYYYSWKRKCSSFVWNSQSAVFYAHWSERLLFADCRHIFYFSPKKRYIKRKRAISPDHQSPQPSIYIDKCITVSHFGEQKRLHHESSKQNYSIISLRAIIKAIFASLLCTPIQSTCILRFSRSGFFRLSRCPSHTWAHMTHSYI